MRFFSNPLAFLRNLRSAEPLTNTPDLQQPENPKKIQRQNQYNFKGRSYFKKSSFSSLASLSTFAGLSSTKGSLHSLRVRPSWPQDSRFCAFSAEDSNFSERFLESSGAFWLRVRFPGFFPGKDPRDRVSFSGRAFGP